MAWHGFGTRLPQVKVDEVLRLVSHVRPKVTPDDAVPRRLVLLVELLLDESGNILSNKKNRKSGTAARRAKT